MAVKFLIDEDIAYSHKSTKSRLKEIPGVADDASDEEKKEHEQKIILRRPTHAEIDAAGTNPSDYQIGQVRIFSKVLYDFGLISQIYRSKSGPIVQSNIRQLKKYKGIFDTFLQKFNENEPISNVRKALDLVKNETVLLPGDFDIIINKTKNLTSEEELKRVVEDIYKNAVTYVKDYELSNKEKKRVDEICKNLFDYVVGELEEGHDIKEIKTGISYAFTINKIMKEDYMKDALKLVYDDNTIETASDLEAEINEYIDSHYRERKTGHSNTLIHDEARRNLQKLAIQLKKDGYVGGLTTKNVFDYMKANEPETIDYISETYGIDKKDLSGEHFPTWESVAKFFYSPEIIRKIEYEQLKVRNRAQKIGEVRKGSILTNKLKSVSSRKKTLQKKIQNEGQPVSNIEKLEFRLALKEEEYKKAKEAREKMKADFDEVGQIEDKQLAYEIRLNYERAKNLVSKIGQSVSSLKNYIKKAKSNPKRQEVKKSDFEKLQQLEKEEQELFAKAKNTMSDDMDVRELEGIINKISGTKYSFDEYKNEEEIVYYSTSFVVNTEDEKIISFIINQLTQVLSKYDKYFNVDAYEPENTRLGGTEIVIDYPQNSAFYESLVNNPSFGPKMMASVVFTVKEAFGVNVAFFEPTNNLKADYPKYAKYIKINQKF